MLIPSNLILWSLGPFFKTTLVSVSFEWTHQIRCIFLSARPWSRLVSCCVQCSSRLIAFKKTKNTNKHTHNLLLFLLDFTILFPRSDPGHPAEKTECITPWVLAISSASCAGGFKKPFAPSSEFSTWPSSCFNKARPWRYSVATVSRSTPERWTEEWVLWVLWWGSLLCLKP